MQAVSPLAPFAKPNVRDYETANSIPRDVLDS